MGTKAAPLPGLQGPWERAVCLCLLPWGHLDAPGDASGGVWSQSHELISLGALGSLMGRKRERPRKEKMEAGRGFRGGHRARLRDRKGKGQRAMPLCSELLPSVIPVGPPLPSLRQGFSV